MLSEKHITVNISLDLLNSIIEWIRNRRENESDIIYALSESFGPNNQSGIGLYCHRRRQIPDELIVCIDDEISIGLMFDLSLGEEIYLTGFINNENDSIFLARDISLEYDTYIVNATG